MLNSVLHLPQAIENCDSSETSSSKVIVSSSTETTPQEIELRVGNNNFMNIYPNPTDGLFYIENIDIITSYSLYNSIGKQMLSEEGISLNTINIDISKFSSGIYFIEMLKENGKIIRRKIIKK